ncbi:uncharacterized protein K452DRAFT_158551 [Aplosporella prunicola CBS 121167]|uniref:GATA-type domain-containing protein n=1 Tax=Aplosporella prunicola CBS 121167 TaxID=1176127 RepID=A0A6A6AV80_9PEZI|nr:uncharacterized protein K452DRAFT_158551 [Aplosporella prunicola CBS 121167]KAF2135849.1 hypothetical protein K452DRAFT_158551 [Aplosporella prunicola CBS 121167]
MPRALPLPLPLLQTPTTQQRLAAHAAACTGVFFVSAQPYPSSPGAALDRFLGLRIERAMLERERARLRAEGAADEEEEGDEAFEEERDGEGGDDGEEGALVVMRMGDAGIPFVVRRPVNETAARKRKREGLPEEFVCQWCDVTSAPEWRRGPGGPKTLCNACGLRWAKAGRKKNHGSIKMEEDEDGGNSAAAAAAAAAAFMAVAPALPRTVAVPPAGAGRTAKKSVCVVA